ncbi:hypothetical protein F3Y22_tig00002793pilonHSYRG00151 [Hibiscus syriacus]|uniref:Uncharacterized protein n=1 Tax=Hibiscus syriacus TaxID=106335 RepID=A0A6A3CR13_HIBSY|nr:hypothetical protein F3Y22_tig00002793pilonHSYRG00151 [Hibiscus syriacus]
MDNSKWFNQAGASHMNSQNSNNNASNDKVDLSLSRWQGRPEHSKDWLTNEQRLKVIKTSTAGRANMHEPSNGYTLLDVPPRRVATNLYDHEPASGHFRVGKYNDPNKRCTNYNRKTNDTPMWRKGPLGPKQPTHYLIWNLHFIMRGEPKSFVTAWIGYPIRAASRPVALHGLAWTIWSSRNEIILNDKTVDENQCSISS